MPRTIRARITLGISALVLMVLLVLSGAVWLLLSRELHQMVDRTLTLGVNQLIPMAELEDGRLHLEKRDDGHAEAPIGPEDLVRLVSADQRVLDSRGSTGVPLDPQALRPRLNLTTVRREDATLMRVATAPVLDQGRVLAYLQVGHSLTDVEQTLGKVRLWLAVLVPLCLGLSALGSYRLAVSALAPVEAIRSQAARTEIEALETGMPIDLPDDEVGRLARTFDQMLKRLAASYAKQKRFTADASHELRTPVSVIRGVAEVALANKRTDEEYRSALATIVNESQSMSRLIGDLLFLARADSSGLRLELETLDLAEVLPAL
ncbi:MAG: HAMP domain-containing protein, partial [Candidatus Eremiobacteraeota bacterium]|nr:HAMP domain-containing protein [Candidatus Eremiobacteraeota bacterium]